MLRMWIFQSVRGWNAKDCQRFNRVIQIPPNMTSCASMIAVSCISILLVWSHAFARWWSWSPSTNISFSIWTCRWWSVYSRMRCFTNFNMFIIRTLCSIRFCWYSVCCHCLDQARTALYARSASVRVVCVVWVCLHGDGRVGLWWVAHAYVHIHVCCYSYIAVFHVFV